MNKNKVITIRTLKSFCILFFCAVINCMLISWIVNDIAGGGMKELSVNDDNFRRMDLSRIDMSYLLQAAEHYEMDAQELMLTAIYNNLAINEQVTWDSSYIWSLRNRLVKKYHDFSYIKSILKALMTEMEYFPIAASIHNVPFVEFVDSWQFERTYGGKRLHEGCDIMGIVNERGLYPVVSVSDGTVEKMGWLEKGGYRVGVRSDSGIYYYYAHLAEYADIREGDTITAGELLGFMGDTGYGTEGTMGKFDVHLHFGIYVNDGNGNEVSINPYWFLKLIQNKVLYFDYRM
ncbi:MAG: M23 family metallopeptidase [Thermoflexaceae bacterium]|nr:M23 family metallopeptidase [Thermoflexaceae bacterium]